MNWIYLAPWIICLILALLIIDIPTLIRSKTYKKAVDIPAIVIGLLIWAVLTCIVFGFWTDFLNTKLFSVIRSGLTDVALGQETCENRSVSNRETINVSDLIKEHGMSPDECLLIGDKEEEDLSKKEAWGDRIYISWATSDKILVSVYPQKIKLWDVAIKKEDSAEIFKRLRDDPKDNKIQETGIYTQSYLSLIANDDKKGGLELKLEQKYNTSDATDTTSKPGSKLKKYFTAAALNQDGNVLAVAMNYYNEDRNGNVLPEKNYLWKIDLQPKDSVNNPKEFIELIKDYKNKKISALAFNKDNNFLAVGFLAVDKESDDFELVNMKNMKNNPVSPESSDLKTNPKTSITALAFNHVKSNQDILAISYDSRYTNEKDRKEASLSLWKLNNGKLSNVKFSKDGKNLEMPLKPLEELKEGDTVDKSKSLPSSDTILSLEFSPNDDYLVAGIGTTFYLWEPNGDYKEDTYSGRINLWKLTNPISKSFPELVYPSLHKKYLDHNDWVSAVRFNPKDDHLLASGSYDKTIKLWKLMALDKGKKGEGNKQEEDKDNFPISLQPSHMGFVKSLAFSSDGTRLASQSLDGTIKIWQMN